MTPNDTPGGAPVVLPNEAAFSGYLEFAGPVRVDGRIEGELVAAGPVWIGAQARVRASIRAPEVVVEGVVEGNIDADRRVELRASARVDGAVRAPRLQVASGSFLRGHCETQSAPAPGRRNGTLEPRSTAISAPPGP